MCVSCLAVNIYKYEWIISIEDIMKRVRIANGQIKDLC